MPNDNCLQKEPKAQGQSNPKFSSSETELESVLTKLLSRQRFTHFCILSGFLKRKQQKLSLRILVCATLMVTADQKLSYGTENGYDINAIAEQYNALAKKRSLAQLTPQAVEYHIKKTEFTELLRLCYQHLLGQAMALNIGEEEVKRAIELISKVIGRRIHDILAHDGCYFCCHSRLARVFPASRTAHKEGSKGAAQIGLQAGYSLGQMLFKSMEITGGTAYEPHYVNPQADTIILADAAFGNFAHFDKIDSCGAFMVSKGRCNLAKPVVRAFVNGVEIRNIHGKKPKDFLRYSPEQKVEIIIEAMVDGPIVVDSNGVATTTKRSILLRAIRIFDKGKVTWVLTNLPQEVPADAVLALLRLRWLVERAFLNLKSHNNLRGARSKSKHLTKSLIWASLTTALIKTITIKCAQLLYGVKLSLRRCHKAAQSAREDMSWSDMAITLTLACALPDVSPEKPLHTLGRNRSNQMSRPSRKNIKRSMAYQLFCLIGALEYAISLLEPKLLTYNPMGGSS